MIPEPPPTGGLPNLGKPCWNLSVKDSNILGYAIVSTISGYGHRAAYVYPKP